MSGLGGFKVNSIKSLSHLITKNILEVFFVPPLKLYCIFETCIQKLNFEWGQQQEMFEVLHLFTRIFSHLKSTFAFTNFSQCIIKSDAAYELRVAY